MKMTASLDMEVVNFGRVGEQPAPRFGADHTVRDEVPAINPEITDFMDRQEKLELDFLAKHAEERRGQIAVKDTVVVNHHNGSPYL